MSFQDKIKTALPIEDAVETEDRAAQVAGLCWRVSDKKIEVLLVTSRDTGRWIIPKGWTMKGKSKAEAALQEAYEEAGVEGSHGKAIGDYAYVKLVDPAHGIPCRVQVYPIKVRKLLSDYPEKAERQRKWFTPEKAATKVDEPELQELLRAFHP